MALSDKLKNVKVKRARKTPLWKGPETDGVTYSMLSRFLACRERFRVGVIEGWRPAPRFIHRIEYGQMWHTCEEAHAERPGDEDYWQRHLLQHAKSLAAKYRESQEQIQHWYYVCRTQFPVYVRYWAEHPDVKQRTPLLQEQVFDVRYTLPTREVVRLRGKWDSVDLIQDNGGKRSAAIYLQENKTAGDVDDELVVRRLRFDLQTMLYAIALSNSSNVLPASADGYPLRGVRYNVVRRPLSGGKGSIRQHKPTKSNPAGESKEAFYARLGKLIEDEPEYYFHRWKVEITQKDIETFQRQCLDPLLMDLIQWYDHVTDPNLLWQNGSNDRFAEEGGSYHGHYRFPYGVYNPTMEGGVAEMDEYLDTGSTLGLVQADKLFEELV